MKNIMLMLMVSTCCILTVGCTSDSDKNVSVESVKEQPSPSKKLTSKESKKAWKKMFSDNPDSYFEKEAAPVTSNNF